MKKYSLSTITSLDPKGSHRTYLDTEPPLEKTLPAGPYKSATGKSQADLLLFVPRNQIGRTIDDLTGRHGYSHLAIDCGEMDVTTGRHVMIESTVAPGVHYAFLDEYGERPFVRIPLQNTGIDLDSFCTCVHSRIGEQFNNLEILTLGILDNPARQICSDVATVCLPEEICERIVRCHDGRVLHPLSVARHEMLGSRTRLFVSPNGYAEFFGLPRGRSIHLPDQLVEPQMQSTTRKELVPGIWKLCDAAVTGLWRTIRNLLLCLLIAGCTTTSPADLLSTARPAADFVLVGAGDIASCDGSGDEATANLVENIPGTVFTTGDNAYPSGTYDEFINCYDPSWGRFKDRTFPSAGNHDYAAGPAEGYFRYFGAAAGNPGQGYYSYELGAWHIIVLNSNLPVASGSAQEQWLRADLGAHPAVCTLAYWHHPLFSSGRLHGGNPGMKPLWQALYEYGADVVLNGHEHNYERFEPQTPEGGLDPQRGIRQFVVGTGGMVLYSFGPPIANSAVRDSDTFGVLKLTLHAGSYSWEFIPEAGKAFVDSGTASCVE